MELLAPCIIPRLDYLASKIGLDLEGIDEDYSRRRRLVYGGYHSGYCDTRSYRAFLDKYFHEKGYDGYRELTQKLRSERKAIREEYGSDW